MTMNRIATSAAALMAMMASAYAGETSGVVAQYDPATRTIMLEDGTTYVLAEQIDDTVIVNGQTVKIVFDDTSMQAVELEVES
jgi:outer membrane lipoprotein SlyB